MVTARKFINIDSKFECLEIMDFRAPVFLVASRRHTHFYLWLGSFFSNELIVILVIF